MNDGERSHAVKEIAEQVVGVAVPVERSYENGEHSGRDSQAEVARTRVDGERSRIAETSYDDQRRDHQTQFFEPRERHGDHLPRIKVAVIGCPHTPEAVERSFSWNAAAAVMHPAHSVFGFSASALKICTKRAESREVMQGRRRQAAG